MTRDVTDELRSLGEAGWRPPPSRRTALSSSFTAPANSAKLTSEFLPLWCTKWREGQKGMQCYINEGNRRTISNINTKKGMSQSTNYFKHQDIPFPCHWRLFNNRSQHFSSMFTYSITIDIVLIYHTLINTNRATKFLNSHNASTTTALKTWRTNENKELWTDRIHQLTASLTENSSYTPNIPSTTKQQISVQIQEKTTPAFTKSSSSHRNYKTHPTIKDRTDRTAYITI